jgi:hypothetical protein
VRRHWCRSTKLDKSLTQGQIQIIIWPFDPAPKLLIARQVLAFLDVPTIEQNIDAVPARLSPHAIPSLWGKNYAHGGQFIKRPRDFAFMQPGVLDEEIHRLDPNPGVPKIE